MFNKVILTTLFVLFILFMFPYIIGFIMTIMFLLIAMSWKLLWVIAFIGVVILIIKAKGIKV
jgi:hypothetical protein